MMTTLALRTTRTSWHRVAEHVLAAALYAATGRIGLSPAPNGVRTPPFGADGRVVEIDGADLVVRTADRLGRRAPLTTLRAAGRFVGVEPAAPAVYPAATSASLDDALAVDPAAGALLAGWFTSGERALAVFAAGIAADGPSEPTLWPEHFDLAIAAAGVNYGVSPGDAHSDLPYAYVGPHAGRPPGGSGFWNAPFGAAREMDGLRTVEEVVAFFREGRALAHSGGD